MRLLSGAKLTLMITSSTPKILLFRLAVANR